MLDSLTISLKYQISVIVNGDCTNWVKDEEGRKGYPVKGLIGRKRETEGLGSVMTKCA